MEYQMEELLAIVSELAQKYTGCESTSVTYEKAQSLMESVLYCLNEYNNSNTGSLVSADISVKEQYHRGLNLLYQKVEQIRNIFNEISYNFEDFGVKCLYDTVQKGIPQFLKWYDIKFCPQNTILTLDYPLITDCSFLTGADAVYQYIQAVQIEQRFLSAFDKSYVIHILEQYNAEYQNMIENICSIILTNIISHTASDKLREKPISEIEQIIKQLIETIVKQFYADDADMTEYLCHEANHIAVRIKTAAQYGTIHGSIAFLKQRKYNNGNRRKFENAREG